MLPITRQISNYNHYKGNDIKYIVLHYVGATGTAKNNADYFCTGDRQASAHYFVDDGSIYQVVEDFNGSWAVGNTRTEVNNKNSINIEMCCPNPQLLVSEKTEQNTIELVQYLMKKYNISITNIRTHYEVSGNTKVCPNWSANNWSRWHNFKNKLTGNASSSTSVNNFTPVKIGDRVKVKTTATHYATGQAIASFVKGNTYTVREVSSNKILLDGIMSWVLISDVDIVSSSSNNFTPYRVKITTDVLNVRAEATTNSKIVTTVKMNEVYTIIGEKNNWGFLKSQIGWICLDYTKKI